MLPLPLQHSDDGSFADPKRGFTFHIAGDAHGHVAAGVKRFLRDAKKLTGKQVSDAGEIAFHITIATEGNVVPQPGDDESYGIRISPDVISLDAGHWRGALHGLTSLLQHFSREGLACGTIKDEPRFGWRGLKLDCVRHFMSVQTIKRTLDIMAFAKMNVLHWGLTNDQGFRLECESFPQLHEKASGGNYYSKDQVFDLLAYAAQRGIRIVPEFNMPGHSTAFLLALPELAAGEAPTELKPRYGVFDAEFNPAIEETYDFIKTFVAEYAPLFPDPYWHFGGDEVTGKNWEQDERVCTFNEQHGFNDKAETQAHFTQRLIAILQEAGKQPMAWEEVTHGKPNPSQVLIESWISAPDDDACAAYDCVSATGYYLDHFLTAADHYRVDPGPRALGGEACAWAEAMQDHSIDIYLWPRAAAVAERLWSPASVKDEDDLYARMARWSAQAEMLGSEHNSQRTAILNAAAGGAATDALRTLASGLRPTAYYFLRWEGYSTETATDRLVQALDPDPAAAQQFNRGVERFVKDGLGQASLEAALNNWLGAARGFAELSAPNLREDQPVADAMAELAALGYAAIQSLETGAPLPNDASELLDRTKPFLPARNDIPGILEALFPILNDESRPNALKMMGLAFWPGVNALVQAALDRTRAIS